MYRYPSVQVDETKSEISVHLNLTFRCLICRVEVDTNKESKRGRYFLMYSYVVSSWLHVFSLSFHSV